MIAFELELNNPKAREQVVRDLAGSRSGPLLVLDTCQRLECFGFVEPRHEAVNVSRTWEDARAFERLARIAAGLESRIVGELEVLGQVRTAYREFLVQGSDHRELDRIFQDALAVARKARRESGVDDNLTSLGALAARHLIDHSPAGAPFAVVGSGSLAAGVARYLGKRGSSPVHIASRCPENALRLANSIGGFASGLDKIAHLFRDVVGIITATAAPHPLVYAHHLKGAQEPLTIIDLGVPPDCEDAVTRLDHVCYMSLQDVEARAQTNLEERRCRARTAASIIHDGALAWAAKR